MTEVGVAKGVAGIAVMNGNDLHLNNLQIMMRILGSKYITREVFVLLQTWVVIEGCDPVTTTCQCWGLVSVLLKICTIGYTG